MVMIALKEFSKAENLSVAHRREKSLFVFYIRKLSLFIHSIVVERQRLLKMRPL